MDVFINTFAFDIFIVTALFALIALYNTIRGVGVSLILAVAIPIAAVLFSIFPYYVEVSGFLAKITPSHADVVTNGIVFAVLLALSLSLPRVIMHSGFGNKKVWRILAVSAITTVFMLLLIFKTLGLQEFGLFSNSAESLLSSDTFSFWVIVLSLGVLFFI